MRGQSFAEFIVIIFLFSIIVISLFTTLIIKFKSETEKVGEQESCLNANGLATALTKDPGQPSNWNTQNLAVFGLSNSTADFISYDKWLKANSIGYVHIRNKTVPDTSYLLKYQIYAFTSNTTDSFCPKVNDSAVLCRVFNGTLVFLTINATSSLNATFSTKLFFPFSTVDLNTATFELNDINTTTRSTNGTTIELTLYTNSTDSDQVNLTSTADLTFIQSLSYKNIGDADLPIYVGNISAKEKFGSASADFARNSYCLAQRVVSLVSLGNEIFPINFEVIAW